MSSFTKPVQIEWSEDHPRLAKTLEGYVYYLEWNDESDYVAVPAGFLFDGASTPARYDFILPRWNGKTIKAALIHDYAYKFRTITTMKGHTYKCTRKDADKIFLDMLRISGEKYIKRSKSMKWYRRFTWRLRCNLAYMALRAFGWIAWGKHRFNEWRSDAH